MTKAEQAEQHKTFPEVLVSVAVVKPVCKLDHDSSTARSIGVHCCKTMRILVDAGLYSRFCNKDIADENVFRTFQ